MGFIPCKECYICCPIFLYDLFVFNYVVLFPPSWNVHLQECIKAEENKPVDDTVESFLSHDDDNVHNTSTPFRILRYSSNASNKGEHKGNSLNTHLTLTKKNALQLYFNR